MKKLLRRILAGRLETALAAARDETDHRDRIDTEGCIWMWGCPCTHWQEPFRLRERRRIQRQVLGISCEHMGYPAPGRGHGWWCVDDLHAGPENSIAAVAAVTRRELLRRTRLTELLYR